MIASKKETISQYYEINTIPIMKQDKGSTKSKDRYIICINIQPCLADY